MKIPFLSLQPQHEPIEAELQEAFKRVLKSNWFILGKELQDFETAFAAYCGTKYSVGVANGLDAIILSLRALGVGAGDEVIVPSNTYIATWLAVSAVGGRPVPVEPDINTYNIDPLRIESAITEKTKAIIPVHLYGQACDMTAIMALAAKYKLIVVEDNAQAHGATCNGKRTGSFGLCNATSFYPGKNLGALGDGGAITTNDSNLYEKICTLRNYGSVRKYYNEVIGVNSRLDELQAAILSVKLKSLTKWTKQRQCCANYYMERLNGKGDLILPHTAPNSTHVYHLFVIQTKRRDELQEYLASHGIQTMIHYPVPPSMQGAYQILRYKAGDFPIAEALAETCLSLPLWPGLSESEMDRIVTRIDNFFNENFIGR